MQSKISSKNLRSHKLFAETPIFKAILKVAIPGLLMSFMSGIYIFADQLMLSILIPIDGVHDAQSIYGMSWDETERIINLFFDDTTSFSPTGIVKSALSISAPVTMLLNAIPFLAGVGAGTMYTQSIARNDKYKGLEIWKSTFWFALGIGIIACLLFLCINNSILTAMTGEIIDFNNFSPLPGSNPTDQEVAAMQEIYNTSINTQISWANEYAMMLAIGTIVNTMLVYFSFMIRAEGRMKFVTIASILCNLLNILLDFIFIYVAKEGMMGGGLATLIGWLVNLGLFIAYIIYLNKMNSTWMNFRALSWKKTIRFSWKILLPVLIIGLSVFLRNFSNSIASMIFQPTLANLGDLVTENGGQYWQMLSGAVMPIMNLFFFAVFGIADGVRPLTAYNYSTNNYKRVRQSYYITIGISFAYGLLIFLIILIGLGPLLLQLFGITPNTTTMQYASQYLLIQIIITPITALSIGGLMIFQATNRLVTSMFIAILQGLICFPIVCAITASTACIVGNIWIFIPTNAINAFVASIIISIYSNFFLYKRLGFRKIILFVNNKKYRLVIPLNAPKLSLAQKALIKIN